MIKFNGTDERGRRLIGLGITAMNVQKLKEGYPIHIHADELGFPGEIVIFYGETEDQLAKELKATMEVVGYRDTRGQKRNLAALEAAVRLMLSMANMTDATEENNEVARWHAECPYLNCRRCAVIRDCPAWREPDDSGPDPLGLRKPDG